jgi:polysaccharide biosynthesis/export protein
MLHGTTLRQTPDAGTMLRKHFVGFPKSRLVHSLMEVTLLTIASLAVPWSAVAQTPLSGRFSPITPVQAAPSEAAYTLGAGDRLGIEIFQVPQYSGEREVLVDGSLNLPIVGSISVQGMTIDQATSAVSAQYAEILRRPIVTISLLAPRPLQIGIAGEINRPGSYTLTAEGTQLPTLTQVLQLAGGITQAADLGQVQVIRRPRAAAEQVINIDLRQLLQTGDLRYDLTLRDGDTVFVPTATTLNLAESQQLATASFAADQTQPINIAVIGEVYRPGPYIVSGDARTGEAGVPGGSSQGGNAPTVTRAIQVAGGIRPQADIRQIEIRRPTRSGTQQTIAINLWELLKSGDLRQDVILQEGDTVFIPTATVLSSEEASEIAAASFSPNTIRVNVVGEVAQSGVVEVPPNTPLNQTILAAGGFNQRARRSSVELVRLNLDGTVSRQSIDIDFAQGVNEASNPPLRNNDVVIVGRSGLASFSDALDTALAPLNRLISLPSILQRLFNLGL